MRGFKISIDGAEHRVKFKPAFFSSRHKVFLDGTLLGEFKDSKEAKEGKDFIIDNNVLNVQYKLNVLTPELYFHLNGQLLEISAGHPKTRKSSAFGLIVLLATLNAAIGVVALSGIFPIMTESGFGVYNVIMSIFYVFALGLFKRSAPFLGIALATTLYTLDSAVVVMSMKENPGISGAIVVRIMFFTILIQGLKITWSEFKLAFKS